MICCRLIVMILLFVFTATATVGQLFPQLVAKHEAAAGIIEGTENINFWSTDLSVTNAALTALAGSAKVRLTMETRSEPFGCKEARTYFLVMSILSIVAAALGFISFILSIFHFYVFSKYALCVPIFVLVFLAFACDVVCLALIAYSYANPICKGDNLFVLPSGSYQDMSFKTMGFDLKAGFGLICASAGGFLIIFILECFT